MAATPAGGDSIVRKSPRPAIRRQPSEPPLYHCGPATASISDRPRMSSHDHPPLFEASCARSEVVSLFVLKPALLRASRNRDRFLLESRVDLARSIGSAVD